MKSILSLIFIDVKLLFREKGSLFWSIIFPIAIMTLFCFMFGSTSKGNFGIKVAIVDMDKTSVSRGFVKGFEVFDTHSKEKDVPHMLDIVGVKTEEEADALLKKGKIVAVIEIPKGFSKQINAIISGEFIKFFKIKTNPANIVVKYKESDAQTMQVVVDLIKKVTDRANEGILRSAGLYTRRLPIALSEIPVEVRERFDYTSYILPGVIVMAIMTTTMFGIAEDVTKLVEKDILKRMFVTPLTKGRYILSRLGSTITISFIQMFFLFITAMLLFNLHVKINIASFLLISFAGIFCMFSLGFLATALGKTREGATAIANVLMWPMMFFGTLWFPMTGGFLPVLSRMVPTTYFVDGLRSALGVHNMGIPLWQDLLWLAIWIMGFSLITLRYFRWEKI